jgi:hypothetical protein
VDLYPVKVNAPDGVKRNLRLRSDATGSVVWQFDRATGAVTEFVRTGDAARRVGATQNWQIGDYVFEPQRGCGCNHPMYAWVPPAAGSGR